MFWTESIAQRLWSANLDGTDAQLLFGFDGDANPLDMELDPLSSCKEPSSARTAASRSAKSKSASEI